ncbi:MAG TPA: SusC/RagA family TonB-linked outer membrane protein [Puia sp.]|nr:SusC/RagA family TonB-linked outer membrane protein [Puia sp.]
MKLIVILILGACLQVSARGYAQTVTLSEKNASLEKIFREVKKQTGYDFFYESKLLKEAKKVDITVSHASLEQVLTICFRDQPLSFSIVEKTILVKPKPVPEFAPPEETAAPPDTVRGHIVDEKGNPIVGATISVKGTSKGVSTDANGNYSIVTRGKAVLVISYVGYATQEITPGSRKMLNIDLKLSIISLGEVVSTGKMERKMESFTGAVLKVSGDELKAVGNENIIQSLKTLDPSFIVVDNNSQGSNPNNLPTIELRGKTSLSTQGVKDVFSGDPNLPLFVLDGFESDLATIVNLDMNRVASVTVLKDAASTAAYGSKAANGVVVVETKRPVKGKLSVSYTADFRVQVPDMNSYNLMNASEKLQFEKLAGRWHVGWPSFDEGLDSLYNQRLLAVKKGVNTKWINIPVRTGFNNGHSLYVSGGSDELQFGIGLNYKKDDGVMKGSDRQTWGGTIDLRYRYKRLNIYNKLYLSGYNFNESPYGSFSTYAQTNPYFTPLDSNGQVSRYLDQSPYFYDTIKATNPLYNADLPSKNYTNNFGITNNLALIYSVSNHLRVEGALQLQKDITTTETFVSPQNTMYDQTVFNQKGSYTNNRADNFTYRTNLGIVYGNTFNGLHQLTANLRGELEQDHNTQVGFDAVGFPVGSNGNPAFASGYSPYGRPTAASGIYRRSAVSASANYVYDNRYLFDASYDLDGSTAFGSNRQYTTFWSVGAGINLNNQFHLDKNLFSLFKIRGNIGAVGNQSLGRFPNVSVYQYNTGTNIFGQGTQLQSLANPNLQWQNTKTTSVGTDIALWKGRFSATLNAYDKKTDPLVVVVNLSSTTGLSNYPTNEGVMDTRGLEAMLRYSPIYNVASQVVWTIGITGSMVKSKYERFGPDGLASLNKEAQAANSLSRYIDGNSPDAIWAVPSLGIDPTTGFEVYKRKDGQSTFEYNVDDAVVVGNTRPKVEGVITNNVNYKGFTIGINLRYRIGGDQFNYALFNKVENIGESNINQNFDKRALYDRWFKPGDVAKYKNINIGSGTGVYDGLAFSSSLVTSRFVQKENDLIGESINLGYQFINKPWMNGIGLKVLSFNAYMNDIFHWSTIKAERGTDYPFANAVSFSIRASF